jgi:hypothetical protein
MGGEVPLTPEEHSELRAPIIRLGNDMPRAGDSVDDIEQHLLRIAYANGVTLYWLSSTGASAARSYWEDTQAAAAAAASGQARPEVKIPVGSTIFPGEIFRAPRSGAEKSYPSLSYFNEVDKGGHFAAWEEPELFATEIRAAFKPPP